MDFTPAKVRALLYDYPDLKAEYQVTFGGAPIGDGGGRSGPGRPVERMAIRLADLARRLAWYKGLLSTLTPGEYVLVRCRYFQGMPFTTIAKTVGAAASTVHKRDRLIIQKLTDHLNTLALGA